MPELFQVVTPQAAWALVQQHLRPEPASETLPTTEALGRILARDVAAPHDLPLFARSTMDGYAVRAEDTHGASTSIPALLTLAGEVVTGAEAGHGPGPAEAWTVHTGGMVPGGADAVVMVEQTQALDSGELEVYRPVAAGENVIQVGEDVRQGELLFAAGHCLRPQDLGALLALGLTSVELAPRPLVAILSQGDEVVDPAQNPAPGQVRDINSYTLAALVQQAGGVPLLDWGIIPDRLEALQQAAQQALERADLVVISAGSSVSVTDLTAAVVCGLGQPGILAHGLSVKPGKPTIVAICQGRPVFGLPGNPVSAMVVFGLMVAPTIRLLLGRAPARPHTVMARLARNCASRTGREDYLPVRLEQRGDETWAVPVLGKSNLICTLVRSLGLVRVPLDSNGLLQGSAVAVELF